VKDTPLLFLQAIFVGIFFPPIHFSGISAAAYELAECFSYPGTLEKTNAVEV
jgi:hypothetical protein